MINKNLHTINNRQQGIALFTALIILLITSLLGVAMFRSFGLHEKIAGNGLDKQRSLEVAKSVVRYGEWWVLKYGENAVPITCTSQLSGDKDTDIKICNNMLQNPTAEPSAWAGGYAITLPNQKVSAGGGLVAGTDTKSGGDINYAKKASLYIEFMGVSAGGAETFYRITGAGYGGSSSTVSVVETVFSVFYSATGSALGADKNDPGRDLGAL